VGEREGGLRGRGEGREKQAARVLYSRRPDDFVPRKERSGLEKGEKERGERERGSLNAFCLSRPRTRVSRIEKESPKKERGKGKDSRLPYSHQRHIHLHCVELEREERKGKNPVGGGGERKEGGRGRGLPQRIPFFVVYVQSHSLEKEREKKPAERGGGERGKKEDPVGIYFFSNSGRPVIVEKVGKKEGKALYERRWERGGGGKIQVGQSQLGVVSAALRPSLSNKKGGGGATKKGGGGGRESTRVTTTSFLIINYMIADEKEKKGEEEKSDPPVLPSSHHPPHDPLVAEEGRKKKGLKGKGRGRRGNAALTTHSFIRFGIPLQSGRDEKKGAQRRKEERKYQLVLSALFQLDTMEVRGRGRDGLKERGEGDCCLRLVDLLSTPSTRPVPERRNRAT